MCKYCEDEFVLDGSFECRNGEYKSNDDKISIRYDGDAKHVEAYIERSDFQPNLVYFVTDATTDSISGFSNVKVQITYCPFCGRKL